MLSSSSSPTPTGHRTRRAALITVGTALAIALGACSGNDDDTDSATTNGNATATTGTSAIASSPERAVTYDHYVALGDSFAALGPVTAPTTGPAACMRSTRGYPALVAQHPSIGGFTDATCGGATTSDMTQAQIAETPPQFDALTADTDLVTLSIGGNDINFGAIARCVARTSRDAVTAPCRDRLEVPVSEALDDLPDALDEVYRGIDRHAPGARVVTSGYMPLVPDHGGCDFVSGMGPGDVTWTRHITKRINLIASDAAGRAGAEFVMPPEAGEHHACAPVAERYTDFTGVETGSHPMHPTAVGQRAMADAIIAEL